MADIKITIRETGDWDTIQRNLEPHNFEQIVQTHFRPAIRASLFRLEREARNVINSKTTLRANALLTVLIKKSSTPLLDHGQLFAAITHSQKQWNKGAVGVFRRGAGAPVTLDDKAFNLARLLHEGGQIPVTPKMRAMFMALYIASTTGEDSHLEGRAEELWEDAGDIGWKPLKATTKFITIPPRPFMAIAFKQAHDDVVENFIRATRRIIDDITERPSARRAFIV